MSRGGWGTGRWGRGRWGRNTTTITPPAVVPELGGQWAVYVRDSIGRRVAQVEDYVLQATARFNDVGAWVLTTQSGTDAELMLRSPGAGIIVTRDGATFISGPVTEVRRKRSGVAEEAEVSGVSDDVLLRDRLAYPEAPALTTDTASHWPADGVCETVMRQLVDVNLGASAPLERQAVELEADLARGAAVRDQFRFQTVLEALQRLATNGGLGFRVVQDPPSPTPRFVVFVPADRRASVVLSDERGTLGDYAATISAPAANVVVVAGQGEGTARAFRTRTDGTSLLTWRRVEVFRDARDTADTDMLATRGDETLAESAERIMVEVSPILTAGTRYGTDYGLGDQVSAIVAGLLVTEVVRSVTVRVDAEGEDMTPVLSTTGAASRVPFIAAQRALAARLTNLETT